MIYFTSDTHFSHKNIIKYSKRPFNSIDEMDETLIKNWNSKISDNDIVNFLGDFCFGDLKRHNEIFHQLNGKKHLIKGNHDKSDIVEKMPWESIADYKEIKFHRHLIILCHYPMRSWNKMHRGSWMLYGHCHANLPELDYMKSTDVGVDNQNYTPVSFDDLKPVMDRRVFRPVDHHF